MTAQSLGHTGRDRAFVAWSAIFGYGFDFYNLIIMAFLLAPIQKTLGISLGQNGVIISVTLGASILGGIAFGWLGDAIGRKNALLATLLLLAAGSLLSALAWDFYSLLGFRALTGIGVGGEWGVGMVLLNEVWDSRKRGLGSAVVQAMSFAGTALASIVATFALAHFAPGIAWRGAMAVGGLPLLLMLFVRSNMPESHLWQEYQRRKASGELPPEKQNEGSPLLEMLRGRALIHFVVAALVAGGYVFNYQSISIFMPTLMTQGLGATLPALRGVTLTYCVFAAAGMVATGLVSDAWGRRTAVLLSTVVGIAGLAGLYFAKDRFPGGFLMWPLFWWYIVWGVGQGAISQFGPWFAELYPTEVRATATSTIFTTGRLIGAAAPYLAPVLAAPFHGLRVIMVMALAGSVVSILMAFLLPETAGRRFAVVEEQPA